MKYIHFSVIFLQLLLLSILLFPEQLTAANSVLDVGITSPQNKVFLSKPFDFKGQISTQAAIEIALNESESTQLVLFPKHDFERIRVTVDDLDHENKIDTIDAEFIQINPIGFVNLQEKDKTKSNSRSGFHPDILLSNQRFNLTAEVSQSILVTITTTAKSVPGLYFSTIKVNNDAGVDISIALTVRVHQVRIPAVRQFKSLSLARNQNYSAMWPQQQGFQKLKKQQKRQIFKRLSTLGFKNHLPPTAFLVNGLRSYNWKGEGKTSVSYPTHDRKTGLFNPLVTDQYIRYMQQNGANSFFIGLTSDIYKNTKNSLQREQVLLDYLDDLIPHLKKRGILAQSYLYNIDEPWGEAVDHAKKTYQLVKKRYGEDIRVMQNSNQNNDKNLAQFLNHFDAIDINLGFYKINKMQRYREKYPELFKDVWWNVNLWPRSRPNLLLEYPLIDARIMGPMSFAYNIQGFEYWDLTFIERIKNYRPVKANDFRLDWIVGRGSLDGLLLYPNEDYGFYSSMRLASFRDGMEDLELLYLLQKLDSANDLLVVDLVQDIENYNENIVDYMNFRHQLLVEITRLQRKLVN